MKWELQGLWKACHLTPVSWALHFSSSKFKSLHFHLGHISFLLSPVNYSGTLKVLADVDEQVPLWFGVDSLGLGKVSGSGHLSPVHLFLLSCGTYALQLRKTSQPRPNPILGTGWKRRRIAHSFIPLLRFSFLSDIRKMITLQLGSWKVVYIFTPSCTFTLLHCCLWTSLRNAFQVSAWSFLNSSKNVP